MDIIVKSSSSMLSSLIKLFSFQIKLLSLKYVLYLIISFFLLSYYQMPNEMLRKTTLLLRKLPLADNQDLFMFKIYLKVQLKWCKGCFSAYFSPVHIPQIKAITRIVMELNVQNESSFKCVFMELDVLFEYPFKKSNQISD